MHIQSWIPLVAAVAYIPLLVIVAYSRPWQRQQKLFLLFLIPIILWSVSDVLFRSSFLMEYKLLLFKIGVCFIVGAAVQYHYFLASFYQLKGPGFPFAYALMAVIIVITALGYFAEGVSFTNDDIAVPRYGIAFIPIALSLFFVLVRDFFFLERRFVALTDPVRRNQLLYLFLGFIVMVLLSFSAVTDIGKEYPLAHVGSVLNASILTYAVIKHRLLDVRVVLRHSLGWLGLAVAGSAIFVLLFLLIDLLAGTELKASTLTLITLAGIATAVVIYSVRDFFIEGVEQLFQRGNYDYRRQLQNFVKHKLTRVSTLDELGGELLSLLSLCVNSESASLLLPETVSGDFVTRFSQQGRQGNALIRLKKDSPISKWLHRENRYLSRESLDIIPEFRSLWDEEREGLKANAVELLFPIVSRGNLIAILALGKKKKGRYLLEDINLAEFVTTQVAASLEKEYLQEQLRKREQELSLFNRLLLLINSSLNIQDAYNTFIHELRTVIDIDWATIALIEDDQLRFEALSTEVGSAWQSGETIPIEGTGAQWVAEHKKAIVEPDLAKNRRFWTGEHHLKQGIRSIVYLPLIVSGKAIGALIIGSRQPNAYKPEQVLLLEHLAAQIGMPIVNSQLYARAEQRARIDELTGLFNRRHFAECLKQEIDQHSRYGGMLSLILLDLDAFKAYNDSQGHPAGDKILVQVGQLIKSSVRNSDLSFRYGGDEFAILLPRSEADDAFIVAERVRKKVAYEMSARQIAITVSLGLACWPGDGITSDEIVNAADEALYYAKRTGGNRTCVVSEVLPSSTHTVAPAAGAEKEPLSIIYALAATIEARDPYTYGHSRKVSNYAVALAEALGLPSEKVSVISTAALLHDIGKIGIPDEVLNKTTKLNAQEWELIKSHPKFSATIVGHIHSLTPCLPAILHHHEKWDGSGYPSGLKGELIPLEARILAIADAFEAMTSPRSYRGTLSYKIVLEELRRGGGTHFDPKLVEAFLPIALATAPGEALEKEDAGSLKADS